MREAVLQVGTCSGHAFLAPQKNGATGRVGYSTIATAPKNVMAGGRAANAHLLDPSVAARTAGTKPTAQMVSLNVRASRRDSSPGNAMSRLSPIQVRARNRSTIRRAGVICNHVSRSTSERNIYTGFDRTNRVWRAPASFREAGATPGCALLRSQNSRRDSRFRRRCFRNELLFCDRLIEPPAVFVIGHFSEKVVVSVTAERELGHTGLLCRIGG